MQLTIKRSNQPSEKQPVRTALMVATCAVLSSSLSSNSIAEEQENRLSSIDLSTFYYSEEERVSVNTTNVVIENDRGDDEVIRASFSYDTITGASPNGRIVPLNQSSSATIPFTSASGLALNVNDVGTAGKVWMTEFTDKRAAIDMSWEKPLTRTVKRIFEGNFSSENDFTSYGGSATLSLDLNQRNTTLTAGLAMLEERVSPDSGTPLGLSIANCNATAPALPTWANCNITNPRYGDGSKRVFDGVFGVTQVVNKRTVMQLNYSHGVSLGYLTDPYKLISVVDYTLDGEETLILYENRPDRRTRNSLYWKTVSQLNPQKVVDFSYRYFWDDWGINSHTIDFKYRYDYAAKRYIQPHVRVNIQNSADFFSSALDAAIDEQPKYASADYRLGKLNTYTIGLKYGKELGKNGLFTLRAEYISQHYSGVALPNMKALFYQGTFTFKF